MIRRRTRIRQTRQARTLALSASMADYSSRARVTLAATVAAIGGGFTCTDWSKIGFGLLVIGAVAMFIEIASRDDI